VINASTNINEKNITVGMQPRKIAVNLHTNIAYIVNKGIVGVNELPSVSVINILSNKVAAAVTLNVHPGNSGTIICDKKESPINAYVYIDAGTKCTAQPNNGFEFGRWVENRKPNSTIPLSDTSANLTINRYGTFTANFEPLPPAIPPQYLFLVVSVIVSSLIGWSIPSIIGWIRAKRQRKYLKECINQIGKLDKNAIEKMITGYYVDGKISQDHRQLLKDSIAEYYDNKNGKCSKK
jgi:hypothetical protein